MNGYKDTPKVAVTGRDDVMPHILYVYACHVLEKSDNEKKITNPWYIFDYRRSLLINKQCDALPAYEPLNPETLAIAADMKVNRMLFLVVAIVAFLFIHCSTGTGGIQMPATSNADLVEGHSFGPQITANDCDE